MPDCSGLTFQRKAVMRTTATCTECGLLIDSLSSHFIGPNDLGCPHTMWTYDDQYRGENLLERFLLRLTENDVLKDTDVAGLLQVPEPVLEANRRMLEDLIKGGFQDVGGWLFGSLEQQRQVFARLLQALKRLPKEKACQ